MSFCASFRAKKVVETWSFLQRDKVDMDPIPVRLNEELQARIDFLAQKMALSRSAVMRLAIQQWTDAATLHGLNPLADHGGGPMRREPGAEGPGAGA